MRRAQGIADIFMYIFVLFLLIISVAITGVAHVFSGVKGSFTINSLQARDMFHTISLERSSLAALDLTSSGKPTPNGPPLVDDEQIAMVATQRSTGTAGVLPITILVKPAKLSVGKDGSLQSDFSEVAIKFRPSGSAKALPAKIGVSTDPAIPGAGSSHQFAVMYPGFYAGAPRAYPTLITAKEQGEVKWDATS